MSDHDRSFIDQIKDALGMGNEPRAQERPAGKSDEADRQPIDMETGGGGDVRRDAGAPLGGVAGAPEASGRVGATGGTGSSAAMGGAGAGGPIGDEPPTSSGASGDVVDANAVRTEYEMGHELDPEHERYAESGVIAERTGTAVNDTWRDDGDEWAGEASGRPAAERGSVDDATGRPDDATGRPDSRP